MIILNPHELRWDEIVLLTNKRVSKITDKGLRACVVISVFEHHEDKTRKIDSTCDWGYGVKVKSKMESKKNKEREEKKKEERKKEKLKKKKTKKWKPKNDSDDHHNKIKHTIEKVNKEEDRQITLKNDMSLVEIITEYKDVEIDEEYEGGIFVDINNEPPKINDFVVEERYNQYYMSMIFSKIYDYTSKEPKTGLMKPITTNHFLHRFESFQKQLQEKHNELKILKEEIIKINQKINEIKEQLIFKKSVVENQIQNNNIILFNDNEEKDNLIRLSMLITNDIVVKIEPIIQKIDEINEQYQIFKYEYEDSSGSEYSTDDSDFD